MYEANAYIYAVYSELYAHRNFVVDFSSTTIDGEMNAVLEKNKDVVELWWTESSDHVHD